MSQNGELYAYHLHEIGVRTFCIDRQDRNLRADHAIALDLNVFSQTSNVRGKHNQA